MNAQWFSVKGRFYLSSRDRIGALVDIRVFVACGRVVAHNEEERVFPDEEKGIFRIRVGDEWVGSSRTLSDLGLTVEELV